MCTFYVQIKNFLKTKRAGIKNMKKNDLFLLIGVISVAISAALCLNFTSQKKDYAIIEKDGKELAVLPLDKDAEYDVGGSNKVAIKDGKAYMAYADCPDKLCIKQGAINKSGTPIVCLPNKVTVSIAERKD